MRIYGIEFDQFTVVENSKKPELKVASGWGIFDEKDQLAYMLSTTVREMPNA